MGYNEKMTELADAIRSKAGVSGKLTVAQMTEAVNSITSGGGIDTSDATATSADILQGVTAYAKGKKITGNIPTYPDVTVQENSVIVRKGYYNRDITKNIGYVYGRSEETPYTRDITIPENTYILNGLTIKGDANLTSGNIKKGVSIFDVEGSFVGDGGGMDFYKCASVNSTAKTWNGYMAMLSNGVYSFSEILTENLSYGTGFTPNSGKIYNNDATVSISGLWSGLPSDGLVFYAPLSANASAAETGQALSTLSGEVTYTTVNGIPCAFFDGSSVLEAGTSGLPYSNSPFTLSFFICPTSSPSVDTGVFAFGKDSDGRLISVVYSSGVITLASHGGGWGQGSPTQITWDNTMKHIAFVVGQGDTDNRPLSVYLNGVKVTDTYLRMSDFASDFKMYIGSYWGNADYIPNFTGYLSSLRIYDRALAPDEISTLASEFTITA